MKLLSGGPEARADRAATELLHDEPNMRVVAFHLQPGQQVPSHRSASSVLLQVTSGSGRFDGEGTSQELVRGEAVAFAPGEPHAITAGAEPLRFIAVITPRPS